MSKKPKKEKNAFEYEPTNALTPLSDIQTDWNLAALYYTSENDPRIEADIKKTEKAYASFVKKWNDRDFTKSPRVLAEALTEKEKLASMPEATRPSRYFGFRLALDANDDVAEKRLALLDRRLRKVADTMLFFPLRLGKVSKSQQQKLLSAKALQHFRYYLQCVFAGAQYDLTEDQEKIINLKSSQSHGRWVQMTEKIISNRCITWQGKQLPIPEALATLDTLSPTQKRKMWDSIITALQSIAEVAEHEFNAVITDVRTEDELRGYKKPYSATALSYEDSEKSIENLVAVVSEKGFKLSHTFYKAKAKYHGAEQIAYANKYDPIGTKPVIPFTEAVEICRDVFYGVKPVYGEIFDQMLLNGQIDVYPKKGKQGGAFMAGTVAHPTHVFLNHQSTFQSLETLAHEMGHAIHTERSKTQTPFYQGHSTTTAETASTLFENLVFDAVYEALPEAQKPILLHDRICRDIATIERQIAFFNAELEIHRTIDRTGGMSSAELRACMAKHLRSYLGPAVDVRDQDGYSFVYVSHLRFGFYVYTYTFGLLMSTIMSNRYREDNSYVETIDQFLRSGSSASVADIFKTVGINVRSPKVFENALKNHEHDIAQFSKFVRSQAK